LVAPDVLVMERVAGIRYTDAEATYPDRIDGDRLVRLAIEAVLEHTLIYGVFHGDLHASNVFINPDGEMSLVDFGIVGRLNAEQRAAMVRFCIGFAQMDVRAMIDSMCEFGAIPEGTDIERLVTELIPLAQQTLGLELKAGQIAASFEAMAGVMFSITRLLAKSGLRVPKELVLFGKNGLYLNGFAAALAPDVNLLGEIQPVFEYFTSKYPREMMQLAVGALSQTGGRAAQ
jgi:ubiquinone biosynthesis protein